MKKRAEAISEKLPEHYLEEMQDISDGSGYSLDLIKIISLYWDIERGECTGIALKDKNGNIIHGWNCDEKMGENLGNKVIIVKFNTDDYYSFITVSYPLFMGIQAARNETGLSYSENSLYAEKINKNGFSKNYLARMIMEECTSIDQLDILFDKYSTINGEALIFADMNIENAIIIETTPVKPPIFYRTAGTARIILLFTVSAIIILHRQ
jgi:predicted choloylglycine hydrolase